jgi:Photosynthesis system II assembly factor YCF48
VKDDSARDKAIEKLVTEKLRKSSGTPATACPGAGIIAAYFERTLAPKERAAWEVHFDSCARCQQQIAQLVRMDEPEEAVRAPVAAQIPGRKIFFLRWAWAAPMLLALLVAGLWYTGELDPLLHQNGETPAQVSSPAPAPAKAPETAGAIQASKPPAPRAEKPEIIPPSMRAAKDELQASAKPSEPRSSNAPMPKAQPSPQNQVAEKAESFAAPIEKERVAAAPPPAELKAIPQTVMEEGNIVAPAERSRLATAPGNAGGISGASAGVVGGAPATPAPKPESGTSAESHSVEAATQAAGASNSAKAMGALAARKTMAQSKTLAQAQGVNTRLGGTGFHYTRALFRSTTEGFMSTTRLWRVGPHGLIQAQGADGTWETKKSEVTADLLDISFPSASVGWAVGQEGTVLRSANGGENWTRVASPANEDLVRVTATGADSAEVTTRSGVVFSTADGGASWTRSNRAQ